MRLHDSPLDLVDAYRRGDLSPLEAVDDCLARIDALDPHLNAFVSVEPRVRDEARAATAALPSAGDGDRPFLGVPIAVKDVHDVEGQANTKSSFALADTPVARNDLFIQRLVDAGFLIVGRTASSELAATVTTESPKHGVTRNPWHPEVSASGSSGGSASAVAAKMVPVATGTDGAGSIRLPASACGLVGHKPSRGLIPQREERWEGSSVEGLLTHAVRDSRALLGCVAGLDPYGWVPSFPPTAPASALPGSGLVVGVLPEKVLSDDVDPSVMAAVSDVVEVLARAGATIQTISAPLLDHEAVRLYGEVVGPVGSLSLDYDLQAEMGALVRARLTAAREIGATEYVRAVGRMKVGARDLVRPFVDDVDVLVCPTLPGRPLRHGELLEDSPAGARRRSAATRFTRWVNVGGLPAISIPTHAHPDGLPLGVQLVAGHFRDGLLLDLAEHLEQEFAWLDRQPTWSSSLVQAAHDDRSEKGRG